MEVEGYSDSKAKFVLGVAAISLLSLLPFLLLLWVGLWLSGSSMKLVPVPPGLKWLPAILWILGCVAVLAFGWGLCRRWIQRRQVGKFLDPLDVRLRCPVVVNKPFSVLVKQPVSRPVVIDRLEVSLVCVEETCGTEVSGDCNPWPFIDQRDIYSTAHSFDLQNRLVPAGAAPEAVAEFDLSHETRTQLIEQEAVAKELFNRRRDDGAIRFDDRVVFWQIRVKVLVAGGFVRQAVFLLPSLGDGGPL